MSTYVMTGADFANSRTMARALFGGKEAGEVLLADQRDAIGDDLQRTEGQMADKVQVTIANQRVNDYTGPKHQLLRQRMLLAGIAVFESQRVADLDLVPILHELLTRCRSTAPVDSGEYRGSFRSMVNGVVRNPAPPAGGYPYGTILGVTNIAEYASTLETPEWMRPMRAVYAYFRARYRNKLDVRFRFAGPDEVGGRKYSAPVIEIAHRYAMGGRDGIQIIRSRSARQRRNPRARRR